MTFNLASKETTPCNNFVTPVLNPFYRLYEFWELFKGRFTYKRKSYTQTHCIAFLYEWLQMIKAVFIVFLSYFTYKHVYLGTGFCMKGFLEQRNSVRVKTQHVPLVRMFLVNLLINHYIYFINWIEINWFQLPFLSSAKFRRCLHIIKHKEEYEYF